MAKGIHFVMSRALGVGNRFYHLSVGASLGTRDSKPELNDPLQARDAAVLCRDRDGRILFRTEPVSNPAIVSAGYRTAGDPPARDQAQQAGPARGTARPPVPPPIPEGCDPVVCWFARLGLLETLHQTGRRVTLTKRRIRG